MCVCVGMHVKNGRISMCECVCVRESLGITLNSIVALINLSQLIYPPPLSLSLSLPLSSSLSLSLSLYLRTKSTFKGIPDREGKKIFKKSRQEIKISFQDEIYVFLPHYKVVLEKKIDWTPSIIWYFSLISSKKELIHGRTPTPRTWALSYLIKWGEKCPDHHNSVFTNIFWSALHF